MTRARALATALVVAVCALTAGTAGAAAPGPIHLIGVDTSKLPGVTVTLYAPGQSASPHFTVNENGQAVSGVQVAGAARGVNIVLALDSSQSMRGAPLTSALTAAQNFVAAKQTNDSIEVESFGDQALVVQPLVSDPAAISAGLAQVGVSSKSGTVLYDAVAQAAGDLGHSGPGLHILVLLTDGADTGSKIGLAGAIAAAHKAGVSIYAIALRSPDFKPGPLQAMTSQTSGALFTADRSVNGIKSVYARIDQTIRSTYQLVYTTSAAHSPIKVSVGLPGVPALTTSYKNTTLANVIPPSTSRSTIDRLAQKPYARVALAVGVGIALLLGLLFGLRPRREVVIAKRIETYTTVQRRETTEKSGASPIRQLIVSTERIFGQVSLFRHISYLLEQADLPLRAAELFYIQCAAGLLFALLVSAFVGAGVPSLFGLILGAVLPYMFVRIKASKRRKTFEQELPDTLVGIAASLRAGHSFAQAVATVVKEGTGPAAKELGRVESETRLGRPTDVALEGMAKRLGSENFEFVVLAVNIQRQVGGSLAEILDMVADTVRSREQFARKVKALTAMGRASAYVLIAMPFFLALMIFLLNSNYIRPLYATSAGQIMIVIGLVSIAFGTLVMRKIVNFKY